MIRIDHELRTTQARLVPAESYNSQAQVTRKISSRDSRKVPTLDATYLPNPEEEMLALIDEIPLDVFLKHQARWEGYSIEIVGYDEDKDQKIVRIFKRIEEEQEAA